MPMDRGNSSILPQDTDLLIIDSSLQQFAPYQLRADAAAADRDWSMAELMERD